MTSHGQLAGPNFAQGRKKSGHSQSWASAGHKPVGHTKYLRLRDHCKSEPLIEADILGFVGLQVRQRAAVVHARAELSQHGAANSFALKVGVDGYRSQMPVRLSQVAACPLVGPLEHSHRCAKWVTKDHGRNYTEFFQ